MLRLTLNFRLMDKGSDINEETEYIYFCFYFYLLVNSETNPYFQPNTERGDPIFYEMVFYTEELLAYKYSMQFDGYTYFWHPWVPLFDPLI
jgi:hypothetical protein